MAINQVLPPDWELTRAGDKRKASVYNAQRAIMEMGEKYELNGYAMSTSVYLRDDIEKEYGYRPTGDAVSISLSRIERGDPLERGIER